jgi:uncharacterized protein (AIM24 family)
MARVIWSATAESFLLTATPMDAEFVFDAVEQMATSRRGFVRNMLDGEGTLGLYVGRFIVLFTVDNKGTIRIDAVQARPR